MHDSYHMIMRFVHDEFGNPSTDEIIPAVMAFVLLIVVFIMVILDNLKAKRTRKKSNDSALNTSSANSTPSDYPDHLD